MKFSYPVLIICVSALIPLSGFTPWSAASAGDTAERLEELMEQTKQGNSVSIDIRNIVDKASTDLEVLESLGPYLDDPSEKVRWTAIGVAWTAAKDADDLTMRRKAVEILTDACADESLLVWQNAAEYLHSFREVDFTESAKEAIRGLLSNSMRSEFILLAGIAQMTDQIELFRGLIHEDGPGAVSPDAGRWYGSLSWSAGLANARMGVEKRITQCIERVQAEPDDILRVSRLLRDLAYIRRPAIIPVLQEYLNSGKRLPPVKETDKGIRYCQYALDLLAQCIEDFPIESVGPGYSDAEIDQARRWMSEQTEFTLIR